MHPQSRLPYQRRQTSLFAFRRHYQSNALWRPSAPRVHASDWSWMSWVNPPLTPLDNAPQAPWPHLDDFGWHNKYHLYEVHGFWEIYFLAHQSLLRCHPSIGWFGWQMPNQYQWVGQDWQHPPHLQLSEYVHRIVDRSVPSCLLLLDDLHDQSTPHLRLFWQIYWLRYGLW